MLKLAFSNPVFDENTLNLTVRYGAKWLGQDGKKVEVCDPEKKEIYGIAEIENTEIIRFIDIRAIDIGLDHDPECRTYINLWNTMKRIYPSMNEHSWVTLVFFYFTSTEK